MQAGNACKEGILAAARAHCDGGAAAVRDRNLQQIIWMLS